MSDPLFRARLSRNYAMDDGWVFIAQIAPAPSLMRRGHEEGRMTLVGLELRVLIRAPLEPRFFYDRRWRWPLRWLWRCDAEEISWRRAERAGWARCGHMAGREPEEGDFCPLHEDGLLEWRRIHSCSCHLGHPPCSACTDAPLMCDECGWRADTNG